VRICKVQGGLFCEEKYALPELIKEEKVGRSALNEGKKKKKDC